MPPTENKLTPRAEDVASLDAIINAMYESISGPKGERDWDRIRSLHLPGSHLIPTGIRVNGDNGLRLLDIEGSFCSYFSYMIPIWCGKTIKWSD